MFKRIAIVNRGEAAMRLIRAVRDMNAERMIEEPIKTIALYTDGEASALFVREADEAYPIGPASERPYLNHDLLVEVLTEARADAVWVGWGFVAEDSTFADRMAEIGITFIGPSGEAMRQLGDKIGSKKLAEQAGVPVAPWSNGGVETLEDALEAAERIGYPLMLKATAGGGGRGIRKIEKAADLVDAFQRTSDEALRAFGSGVLFLEKLVTGARHIEVQLICDGETAWALGVRDCSIQRRNQKIIEESRCPLLTDDQIEVVARSAERLAQLVGYQGAATVEFLYQPERQEFAFLEVNTRLQVEHPITETATSFDLVKAQIRVAAGEKLPVERPSEEGHAIEARLNAEDPDQDFAPAPGRIARLDMPSGPGIRVDSGFAEGDTIPADFDSMIAKIIAYGPNRSTALARLRRALAETTAIIEGGATNKSFILELLEQPEVIGADGVEWADTSWIDRTRAEGRLVADDHAGVALVAAAIEAYQETTARETHRLLETAYGGRPQTQHKSGITVDLKLRGVVHNLTVFATAPHRFRVEVGGTTCDVELQRLDDVHSRLTVNGHRYRLVTAVHGPVSLVEVNNVMHRIARDEGGVLRSHAPALVVATPVAVGDTVEAGAPVIVLESMKMETVIPAPFTARIKDLHVMTGSQVETMAPLVRLEPIDDGVSDLNAEAAPKASLELPEPSTDVSPQDRAARLRADLSAVLMGYDVDPSADTLSNYLEARAAVLDAGGDVLADEIELVALFADLAVLNRNRPMHEQVSTELQVHSDREHFHRYLMTLDAERAGVPQTFVERLSAVLGHYGVDSLDRTPALEEAVFRIFLAQKRMSDDLPILLGILQCWITEPAPDADRAVVARAHLERLVRATQLRYPIVGDLARSVRFRWFDQPQVDAVASELDAPAFTEDDCELWRLGEFDVTRLPAANDVLLFECVAKTNPEDRRLVAMAQVRQLAAVRDDAGRLIGLPHAERAVENCLESIRRTRSARGAAGSKLDLNHVWVHVWPEIDLDLDDIAELRHKITPLSEGAGIEEVLCHGRFVRPDESVVPVSLKFHAAPGSEVAMTVMEPSNEPLQPLDDYASKVLRAKRRGLVYPYELGATLARRGSEVVELDLDETGRLVEVDRGPGLNKAGIIVAKITTPTKLHPEGITRIVLAGDPTKGLGAVAEPECRRIIAAIDLAEELGVPVEWFALSSGARISMDSGTENMDWVGAALRRIVHFTQDGGEINIVVAGINVGAQPYWNAEATMLMHTKGILVMTPDSAMVLTGKQSLDFSGGVSAEDNFGIGGYDRVMGPNGQAQYWAPNLMSAFIILMSHYDHTYVAAGETGPRRAATSDPSDRDVSSFPHQVGTDFATVGEIFSADKNPDRKKPFDIRTVIAAVCDQDHERVERWAGMAEAETAVVIDGRIGGHSVSVIGIESRPVPRAGFPPTDGPDTFTSGTLFPRSSKKVARAINAASGNRPLVVLANLSGFDGSPESMRNLQLEYGAEIGRAITNFDGPIVFVVISRYHGGAFVVFSKALNEKMTVLAVEGSYASVIGGAPAAAVVFAGDVRKRTAADPRVAELEASLRDAAPGDKAALRLQLSDVRAAVRAEKISEIAAEFDAVHDIHRAVRVGSVDRVISPAELRPSIIETIEKHLA